MTITTSAMVSISSYCTSRTDARIVVVRSLATVRRIEPGSVAFRLGSSALTRSTTAMMLALG